MYLFLSRCFCVSFLTFFLDFLCPLFMGRKLDYIFVLCKWQLHT
jgi:hypothetical protein